MTYATALTMASCCRGNRGTGPRNLHHRNPVPHRSTPPLGNWHRTQDIVAQRRTGWPFSLHLGSGTEFSSTDLTTSEASTGNTDKYQWITRKPDWDDGHRIAAALEFKQAKATGLRLTGSLRTGETLTAVTTDISAPNGLGTPTYAYQWERLDCSEPGNDRVISDETSSTYTVVLDEQPASDVTIEITAGGDLRVDPSSLTFTSDDWNSPQTVTVSSLYDGDVSDDTAKVTHTVASGSSSEYLATYIPDLGVSVTDTADDSDVSRGLTLSRSEITEGDEGTVATLSILSNHRFAERPGCLALLGGSNPE